jgi:hypothetical protein
LAVRNKGRLKTIRAFIKFREHTNFMAWENKQTKCTESAVIRETRKAFSPQASRNIIRS